MKKINRKILIIGKDFYPDFIGVSKYTTEMAEWLAEKCSDLRVITSYPYYPEWRNKYYKGNYRYLRENSRNVKIYRCPIYIPHKPTGLKRIIHSISFAISSTPIAFYQIIFHRPSRIILIAPTIASALLPLLLSKLIRIKTIMHVQDLEIDLALELKFVSHKFSPLLKFLEGFILNLPNSVSTISSRMMKKIEIIRRDKTNNFLFPNWVNNELIFPSIQARSSFRNEYGIKSDDFVLLYSGNLAEKQGIENLLNIGVSISSIDNAKMLIFGDGPSKAFIDKEIKKKKLNKVLSFPLVPTEKLNGLLNSADLHIVLQKEGIDDYILPSKITNILAIGGEIFVTGSSNSEIGELIEKYPGIVNLYKASQISNMTKAIIAKILSHREYKLNNIAFQFAESNLHKEKILNEFFERIH